MAEMSVSDVLSFFRREKALIMSVLTATGFMGFSKHWFEDLSHIAGEHPDTHQRQDTNVLQGAVHIPLFPAYVMLIFD